MSSINCDDTCLVCVNAGANLNIFTTYNMCNDREELYVEVIKNCFNIEIAPASGLTALCSECSIKLRKAYTFRHDVLKAVNRLVSTQVTTTNEKQYSEIEYLEDIPFETDYDIDTIVNPETGQMYTIQQMHENEEINENNDHYLINSGNDAKEDNNIFNTSNVNRDISKDERQIDIDNTELDLEPGEIRILDKTVAKYIIDINSDLIVDKKEVIIKGKGKINARNKDITKTIINQASLIYTVDEDQIPVNTVIDLDSELIDDKNKQSKSNTKEKCVNKKVSKNKKVTTVLNKADTLDKINANDLIIQKKTVSKRGVRNKKELFSTIIQNPEENHTTNTLNEINKEEPKNSQITSLMDIENGVVDDKKVKKASKTSKSTKRSKKTAGKKKEASVKENVEEVKTKKQPRKEKKPKETAKPFSLQPDQTVCDLCGARFETHRALSTHMNAHYPQFVCTTCGNACATKGRLRAHLRTHDEGPFACKICDKQFSNANTRNAHAWRVHSKADPFKCRHCGARFPTFLQRLRHLASAHSDTRQYPCQFCGANFAYAAYRTKHIRTMHLNERPHKCPQCPSGFARARELASHLASRHGAGERRHRCAACPQTFYFRTALRRHASRHRHKFACNQCEQKFATNAELATHTQIHEHADSIAINLDFVTSLHLDDLADDYALIDPSYLDLNEL